MQASAPTPVQPERKPTAEPSPALDVARVYQEYADFLWKSLFRMGVSDSDRPDAMQEVLLVVHRRLKDFDGRSRLSTWLFSICLRVASTMYRKHRRRRETPFDPEEHGAALVDAEHPERLLTRRDAQRRLASALDSLDPERRALLVMFELEDVPCTRLAELWGVPVGTIHSRLFAARRLFQRALVRQDAQHRHPQQGSGGSS